MHNGTIIGLPGKSRFRDRHAGEAGDEDGASPSGSRGEMLNGRRELSRML